MAGPDDHSRFLSQTDDGEPGDSDAEDDDGDAGAADPVSQDNKRLRGEVSTHKSQLEALREKVSEIIRGCSICSRDWVGLCVREKVSTLMSQLEALPKPGQLEALPKPGPL